MVLEILRELHDDFSDEIPIEILEGNGNSKVRRNWWHKVVLGLLILKEQDQMPPELRKELDEFVGYYTSDVFKKRPLTTQQDISRANNLLNRVLGRDRPS